MDKSIPEMSNKGVSIDCIRTIALHLIIQGSQNHFLGLNNTSIISVKKINKHEDSYLRLYVKDKLSPGAN